MGLLDKVRILVGALVHKPTTPRPEKVDLDGGSDPRQDGVVRQDGAALQAPEDGVEDTDRVADLIAQRYQEEAD
jgi:hypothetical protein